MRRSIRKAGVACGAAFASAALALSTSTGASAVKTAVAVGGLGTPDMHELVIAPLLGRKLVNENDILDGVQWPAQAKRPGTGGYTLGQSITQGVANLGEHFDDALARLEAGEQFTVVGFSAGSLVVNDFMRELAQDPNAPTKSQVKFILVADSSRQKLLNGATRYNPQYDYTYRPAPDTAYDIDVVTGEYDGAADLPDRWWNFLAVANAIAGGIFVHVPMMFANYEDPNVARVLSTVENSEGGITTTYLVKAKTLPLVQLLPFLKSQEASLKAKIDAGYSRNDNVATATFAARSAAVPETADEFSAAVEDDADVKSADADVESTDADVEGAKDAVESDSDAGDADGSHTRTTKASKNDADEDVEASKLDEDEAEAAEDAENADSDAAKDDEGDGGDEDSTSTTDTESSGGSSSEETGPSDSGASE